MDIIQNPVVVAENLIRLSRLVTGMATWVSVALVTALVLVAVFAVERVTR